MKSFVRPSFFRVFDLLLSTSNPGLKMSERGKTVGRRALKDLKTFFGWCVGRGVIDFWIVEVLALTAQRCQEVTQMAWTEIDEATRTWCIPASRAKNDKAHLVHLSKPVWAIIQQMPRTRHFQAFTLAKRELDRRSGVASWWLHDLRRTVVSGMARLGVPPHVAGKILNHQSGTISGVAAVYQRHEFLAERKDALERWGQHVSNLIATRSKSDAIAKAAA
jgi:integrase